MNKVIKCLAELQVQGNTVYHIWTGTLQTNIPGVKNLHTRTKSEGGLLEGMKS